MIAQPPPLRAQSTPAVRIDVAPGTIVPSSWVKPEVSLPGSADWPASVASDIVIVPVVAVVDADFHLTLNPSEVDDAFEVPLDFLMDRANHQRHSREWQGTLRHYYAMPYGHRYIWGVTAGIIRNLYERLHGP